MEQDSAITHKHKRLKRVLLSLLSFLVAIAIVFLVYVSGYSKASPAAISVLSTPGLSIVETKQYYTLALEGTSATTGFIFYPGGKVDEKAYLPYLAEIAKEGYFCVLIRAPFHLSILNDNAAGPVIKNYPEITTWAVGGHSLGGVSASNFVYNNPNVQGLVLLASYPLKDLSTSNVSALSITGDMDQVLNWERYQSSIPFLPANTTFLTIKGANHGQFGDYGAQKGDGTAIITHEEQRTQMVEATVALLSSLPASA